MKAQTSHGVAERNLDGSLIRWFLLRAGRPRIAVRLWTGAEIRVTDERPVATMVINSRRALLNMLRSPSVGFGEAYMHGGIEIEGDMLAFVNEATAAWTRSTAGRYLLPRIGSALYAIQRNTLGRARSNVHHHYDLGNDFYRLWLDERMVYTCAYFENPSATLAEAQVAKLDHVCRKLDLRPGQKVIEAGCGWGALALHMAEHYGVQVVAFNNSHEQVAWARERARARGLEGRVRFVEDDYRTIDERCDVFVSVGMLEHVGIGNYRTLGRLIRRCLKPEGLGLIHTIGRSHPQKADPWIRKYIFPGGHIPSLAEMMGVFEPERFSVLDVENLRPHYARTCAMWLENFERVADRVAAMYDETFVRMWRLYLAGSSAGFSTGTLQLFQVLFTQLGNRRAPWTREYQYRGSRGAD
ncbi:MAG: cyclopropane-fatty-acyl-phospholipid synthase family protein [Woeseiaceae bacterium]|nr:cyclopropane-fatty-acyl-phospholipid synthase family protein [Woeseiaceae bacterium]